MLLTTYRDSLLLAPLSELECLMQSDDLALEGFDLASAHALHIVHVRVHDRLNGL